MSYTPTNWQTGDTITAEKLNNMEGGIEAAAVVHIPVKTRNTPGYTSFYIDAADADEVYAALTKANSFVFDIYQIGGAIPLIEMPCKKFAITNVAKGVYGNIPHDMQNMFDGVSLPALKADSLYILDNEYQSGSEWTVRNGTLFDTSPLIVTLTPTEQDFSGTMDKTPQEITAAYNAGRQIRIVVPALGGITGICTEFVPQENDVSLWCNFVAHFDELGGDVMITVVTSVFQSAYGTKIFPLTPMT